MLDWLKTKGQDARVYACIKELKWELESADQVQRAKILATASILANEFFSGQDIPLDAINRPSVYSHDDLMSFYETLEDIRNNNAVQIAHTKKMMASHGLQFPKYAEDHAKMTGRALEVWMSTLGAGIAKNRIDDVYNIWKLLAQSKPYLDEAMDSILKSEQMTMELTGQSGAEVFGGYTREKWRAICDFIPSQFVAAKGVKDASACTENEHKDSKSVLIKEIIDLVSGALYIQMEMITKANGMLPEKAFDNYSLGYIAGYTEYLSRNRGIAIVNGGREIILNVLKALLGEKDGPEYHRKLFELNDYADVDMRKGLDKGTEDAAGILKHVDPFGWVQHVNGNS